MENLESVRNNFQNMDCPMIWQSCEDGGTLSQIILKKEPHLVPTTKMELVAHRDIYDHPIIDGK